MVWSEAILQELRQHEQEKLVRRGAPKLEASDAADHLIEQMRTHVEDAAVTGWEALEGSFGLPDPDDEQVVAAAHIGGAGVIVTSNLKDFPPDLLPAGIAVLPPAQFAADTVDIDPVRGAQALIDISRRHIKTPHTPTELLDMLASRCNMREVADLLAPEMPW